MPDRSDSITPRCTRCGSDAMIPDGFFYVEDLGSSKLSVGVYKKPSAMLRKGAVRSEMRVSVCGDCGFVTTEAAEPKKLWDAYVDRLARELDD